MNEESNLRNDELMHYGVIGMKWGVHRGQSAKAYAKASDKLNRMSGKINKYQAKATKKMYKADKKMYNPFSSKASVKKAHLEASKYQNKVDRRVYKAKKWMDQMSKVFADTPQSLSKEQIALGKQYADRLQKNAEMNSMMYKYGMAGA